MATIGNLKFGKAQKKNPTPSSLSNWFDFLTALFGFLMPAVTAAPFIPSGTSDIIVYVLGCLSGVLQLSKPYFGVKVSAQEVPVTDVDVINDTKESGT